MRKWFICMLIACSAVFAAPAEAAPKAMKSIVNRVSQACDDVGGALWRNKGGIGIGAVTVAAVTNPTPFVEGATTVITGTAKPVHQSPLGSVCFYLILTGLAVAGARWLFNYLKDWKNWLPLLFVLLGLGLTCGVAQAGVVECAQAVPNVAAGLIKPLWDAFGFILFILTIFI